MTQRHRPKVGSLVLVDWRDSSHYPSGWVKRRAARRFKPAKVASVGFVAKATRKRIVLVANVGRNTLLPCSGVTVIPWVCVRSVEKLT